MVASISISVDPAAIQIQAGGHASARVTVFNQGDTVGQYVLNVQGIEPAWIKLEPQQMGVFPGDKTAAQLRIHPPADAVSATFRVIIRAENQVNPSDAGEALLTLALQRVSGPVQPGDVAVKPVSKPVVGAIKPQTPDLAQKPTPRPQPPVQAPVISQVAMQASSPSGQLLLTSDRDNLKVLPGASQQLNLGLSNSGGVGLDLELQVKGPPVGWLSLAPGASSTLAPGESNLTTLTISIPAQAPLGDYPLTIIAQGVDEPSLKVRLNYTIEVIKPGDILLELKPPQMEGEISAEFSVQLSQGGLAPVMVNLSARDDESRLDYAFSPASVSIPGNGKVSSRLIVRAKQSLADVESRPFPFWVTASPADGSAGAVEVKGSLIQHRSSPVRLVLAPGEQRDPMQAVFQVSLVNPGQNAATVRLSASDSDGGCSYQFDTPVMNLPGGSEESTRLYVAPLQYVDMGEIIHTFTVSAQTSEDPDSAVRSAGRFIQGAIQRPALVLSPSSQTGPGPVKFSLVVSNPRSTPLHIELRSYDPANQVKFRLVPTSLTIPPLSKATAKLEVFPVSELLSGETKRLCAFSVAGYPADLPKPVVVEGSLLLVHGFTWRKLLPWLIAAILLMGLGAAAILALVYFNYLPLPFP